MNYLIVLAIILAVYFMYMYFTTFNETLYVESDIDNNKYLIRRGNQKSLKYLKESANVLAQININNTKLIDYLYTKYRNDQSVFYFIRKLKQNYHASILSEAALDKRYTTYTVNKKDMHICLRTRDDTENMYDINTLMYVVLHELAHLCNYDQNGEPITGHGSEFKQIFKMLVQEAIALGIYKYENYRQHPRNYCGIKINSQIV